MTEDYRGSSNDPEPGCPAEQPLSADDVFDALASRRRRYVLCCLWDEGTSLALPDVAGEVAVRERGTEVAEIPAAEVERVHASLYHVHVPKLARAGLVVYERDGNLVALSENAESLEPVLGAFAG